MNEHDEQWWIFTFGAGHRNAGHYVKIYGTFASARDKMISKYGLEWAFQYPEWKWNEWLNDPERAWCMETELNSGLK